MAVENFNLKSAPSKPFNEKNAASPQNVKIFVYF